MESDILTPCNWIHVTNLVFSKQHSKNRCFMSHVNNILIDFFLFFGTWCYSEDTTRRVQHNWVLITGNNGQHFASNISIAFSLIKKFEFRLKFHQRLFSGVQSTIGHHWFRLWLGGVKEYWGRHYIDVIMTTMASQITSLAVVYPTVYSDADHRKHQSSASLAFVREIHRGPVNSPHKGPVTRKMSSFDDVIMISENVIRLHVLSRSQASPYL